ncbi:TolC family protein [Parapedobacter sp. DT-150]|uniref:TolC family protein n=1 Tax=Parapedobacter sp. DT-150 TaxID=3396162 RepID=UPI003F19A60D
MKKVRYILLLPVLAVSLGSSAQESIMGEINYSQLESYIQLAKSNYPKSKILKVEEERSKSQVSAAKISYLDFVDVSYYYRPGDRAALNPDNPFVFNGFQFGITLSPGSFLQKPFEVKQAKAEHEIAKLQRLDYERVLESEVKSRYYDYIFLLNEIKVKTEEAQASKALFEDTRLKFERGEAQIESYSSARTNFTAASTALSQIEVNFLKAKDALEEIIGTTLNEVQQ